MDRMASTADIQQQSSFFRLPWEIRIQIYALMWRTGDYHHGVHVNQQGPSVGQLGIYPCFAPTQPNERNSALDELWEEHKQEVRLGRRQKADILLDDSSGARFPAANHAECFEAGKIHALIGKRASDRAPFLPVLLTCKRL